MRVAALKAAMIACRLSVTPIRFTSKSTVNLVGVDIKH